MYGDIGDFDFAMGAGDKGIGDDEIVIGAASEFVFAWGEGEFVAAIDESGDWAFGDGGGGHCGGAPGHCGMGFVGFAGHAEFEFESAKADSFSVVERLLLSGGEAVFGYFGAVGGADIFDGDGAMFHVDLGVTSADAGVFYGDIALPSDDGDSGTEDVFSSGGIHKNGELDGGGSEGVTIEDLIEDEATIDAEHDSDGVEIFTDRALDRFYSGGGFENRCAHDGSIRVDGGSDHGFIGIDQRSA